MGDVFKVCELCENQLSEDEQKTYWETAEYCCNGHDCGCQGMPLHPPLCFKCAVGSLDEAWRREKQRAEAAEAEVKRLQIGNDIAAEEIARLEAEVERMREDAKELDLDRQDIQSESKILWDRLQAQAKKCNGLMARVDELEGFISSIGYCTKCFEYRRVLNGIESCGCKETNNA